MYMEMFSRHNEIRRSVEEIPGGVRTTTESDSPDLAALLHQHVPSMYTHLDQGGEIMCMSQSLPTLFRSASDYHRQITLTPTAWSLSNRRPSQPHESHPQPRSGSHRLRHQGHARDDAGDDGGGTMGPPQPR